MYFIALNTINDEYVISIIRIHLGRLECNEYTNYQSVPRPRHLAAEISQITATRSKSSIVHFNEPRAKSSSASPQERSCWLADFPSRLRAIFIKIATVPEIMKNFYRAAGRAVNFIFFHVAHTLARHVRTPDAPVAAGGREGGGGRLEGVLSSDSRRAENLEDKERGRT